jgi:hypothetical protein
MPDSRGDFFALTRSQSASEATDVSVAELGEIPNVIDQWHWPATPSLSSVAGYARSAPKAL